MNIDIDKILSRTDESEEEEDTDVAEVESTAVEETEAEASTAETESDDELSMIERTETVIEPEADEADEAEAAEEESGRVTGTVKWFNPAKGYGFIERDQGNDVFVHYSAIEDGGGFGGYKSLHDGQRVEFEVESSPKGPRAAHVKPV